MAAANSSILAPRRLLALEGRQFFFVDGGVTPYNIPAFLMFRKATADFIAIGKAYAKASLDIASQWGTSGTAAAA